MYVLYNVALPSDLLMEALGLNLDISKIAREALRSEVKNAGDNRRITGRER